MAAALPQPSKDDASKDDVRPPASQMGGGSAPRGRSADTPLSRRGVPKLYWLLLALAVGLFAWQLARAGALAEEVGTLQSELATAQEELRLNQQRMGVVRSHVEDLSARIGALRTLVADDAPSLEAVKD